jgi:rod shape-determining protein MreC
MLNFFFRNRVRIFLALVFLLSVWILVFRNGHRLSGGQPGKDFSLSLWAPIQKSVNGAIAFPESTLNAIQQLRNLREEVNRLQQENQSLRLELSNHKSLQAELERLKSVLQIKKTLPHKAQIARIIARDPSTWNKSFVIDIGYDDGVSPDSPVISEQGIVGRILETAPKYSRVLMIIDSDSSTGSIDVRSRVTGIIRGTGRNLLRYLFVSPGEDIQTGDTLLSSGLGGVFPKGYSVGTVVKKTLSENGLGVDIEVVPAVDFGVLDYVFVLPPVNVYQ